MASKKAQTKFKLSKCYLNDYWITQLSQIVTNLFQWKGMPEEINIQALEKSIMLGGYAIFFKDETLNKYLALPGVLTGVDLYGYPTMAKPVPLNGAANFNPMKINQECIVMWANNLRNSAMFYIEEYADKLSEIDAAIKLNTGAMKHPVMLKGSETTKQSLETLIHQYDENYYVILTEKSLALDKGVEALNLNVSAQEILNLQKQKETTLNEFYSIFGIQGGVEKRERLIASEMQANGEQAFVNKTMWLDIRQETCKRINKMFGLNVSVDYAYDDMIPTEKEETSNE